AQTGRSGRNIVGGSRARAPRRWPVDNRRGGRPHLGHHAPMTSALEFPPGTPRRRLGNFRTAELADRVAAMLAEAGIASSRQLDRQRPERWGRLLDWVVHMTE